MARSSSCAVFRRVPAWAGSNLVAEHDDSVRGCLTTLDDFRNYLIKSRARNHYYLQLWRLAA
jgi:hypothetical protein